MKISDTKLVAIAYETFGRDADLVKLRAFAESAIAADMAASTNAEAPSARSFWQLLVALIRTRRILRGAVRLYINEPPPGQLFKLVPLDEYLNAVITANAPGVIE